MKKNSKQANLPQEPDQKNAIINRIALARALRDRLTLATRIIEAEVDFDYDQENGEVIIEETGEIVAIFCDPSDAADFATLRNAYTANA